MRRPRLRGLARRLLPVLLPVGASVWIGALAAGSPAGAAAQPAERPAERAGERGPRCGLSAVPTLVGFDTSTGEALLALPAHEGGTYLVRWRQGAETARFEYEPTDAGRFGGSIGPGPIFAVRRCGQGCLQPVRLGDGGWEPLGEPVLAPLAATVHATYDASRHPWLVVHGSSERPGFTRAWAFHLEGREWRSAGQLEVTALPAPGALPAPWLPGAVVSGTGLFPATGEARTWVSALPADRSGVGAQVFPFDRRAAAFLSPEGAVYRSADAGTTWLRSSWTPWGTGEAEPWRRGTDFTIDVPAGVASGALPVLWFDRRLEGREALVYTEMSAAGRWRQVAVGPAQVPTSAGEDLTLAVVLRGDDGRWSSLFGCVVSGGTPRLVVTELSGDRVTPPRLVRLLP